MSWQGGIATIRSPRGHRLAAVLTAASAAVGLIVTGSAGASTARPAGAVPGKAVVHRIDAAGQGTTLAYWTQARMLAAESGARPHAASSVVQPPKGIPTATHFTGVRTTGALFSTTGNKVHFCTASVVNSTTGDLVLTAAHCVYMTGFAANIEYVPEYHSGHMPFGGWAVRTITVADGWRNGHDPDLDFAFLAVGSANGPKIQTVTGGFKIGFTRWYQQDKVQVFGYNDSDSQPIKCLTRSFRFRYGQMEFYCHGFWTGTSGGPWVLYYNSKTQTGTVFGIIGGYEEGGKYDWASYSAYFGSKLRTLFNQAENPPPA